MGSDGSAHLPRSASDRGVDLRSGGFEKVIGTRITAIVGGLLVVAAAAFFAKLAFDRGWIGAVPPVVRAGLLAGAGVGMLLLADLLRRRLGDPAAVGLALAGIGTVYVDGWAMGPVLELVGPLGSLIAMSGAAVLGLFATIRFGSRLIGAASLLAAVAAPYLAGGGGSNVSAGIYFTVLFVTAFALSVVRPRPFLRLRWLSFTILVVGALPWLVQAIADAAWDVVLVTTVAWWFVIHLASVRAAQSGFEWRTSAGLMLASTLLIAIPVPIAMRGLAAGSIEGWVPLALGLCCVAFAFQTGVGLGAFRTADESDRRRDRCFHALAGTAWLEGLTLMMVSVALLLPALGIPIAWASAAVALGVQGRRSRSVFTAVFAGILGLAAQVAASIVTLVNWGGANWFDGTPWEMEPVAEAITIPFAWGAAVALAILWPRIGTPDPGDDRNHDSFGPCLFLTLGILPVLLPAIGIGEMGWWLPVIAAPFVGSSLVARARGERARGDFPFAMGVISLSILVAGFVGGAVWTIGEGSSVWAVVLLVYGGLAAVLLLSDVRRRPGPSGRTRLRGDLAASFVVGIVGLAVSIAWSVGRPDSGIEAARAAAFGSLGMAVGPGLLGMLRWRKDRLIGPSLSAAFALIAILLWSGGLVWLLAQRESPADGETAYGIWIWTGLLHVAMLGGQARTTRTASRDAQRTLRALASFMGLATGSVLLYDLLGPGTILAQAGLSIWWALYAIGLVVVGFVRGAPPVRHAGLVLLGLTAGKFLILDLRGTEPEQRVVSALGIGLLMVGTSVVYARFGRRLAEDSAEVPLDDPPPS
ncbi:MAG: DUF2339 domain-containing protein [Planctomycetota bacterium]|nr:DUF2339 domain-containing protein [Planctomycetota bacterium]